MISEILEIIGTLFSLPDKNEKPNDSKTKFIIFTSYSLSIFSLIFIIPEFKAILELENSLIIILSNITVSILLSILLAYILKKLNLLPDLIFSTFLTFIISIALFFTLSISYLINYFS